MQRSYGWKKDKFDPRDKKFRLTRPAAELQVTLPSAVDLRSFMPPVYDQGDLGSCTANAICAAFEYDLLKQKLIDFMPSRLFVYFNERLMEGTVNEDAGAMIRDGIKVIATQGVCEEAKLPYNISKFAEKPSDACYTDAAGNLALQYERIDNTNIIALKAILASGYPIVFGFTVFEELESQEVATTGILPMPNEKSHELGGHAVLLVGYDDDTQHFIVRNSWGEWAKSGYFFMPYCYVTNSQLASDFWSIKLVENN